MTFCQRKANVILQRRRGMLQARPNYMPGTPFHATRCAILLCLKTEGGPAHGA